MRTLLYLKQDHQVTEFNERQVALVDDALLTWSRFLRGEYKHTGAFEIHMLPLGEIADHGGQKFSPNINRYLTRAVEINAGSSDTICFTYSKLGPFVILGFVESLYPRQWKGTKVEYRGGWFGPKDYTMPAGLVEYLNDRAMRTRGATEKISVPQQEKIAQSVRDNADRFLQSGLFRAMQRDIEMFGADAFAKYDSDKNEGCDALS
jgi:hypothetical protein